jgi:PilZ domain
VATQTNLGDLEITESLNRRRWTRLPVAIPVFIRGKDSHGRPFEEFTTGFDISPGGLLLATRQYVVPSSKLTLEIPSAPAPKLRMVDRFVRDISGRAVTVTHAEQYYLCGVKFVRPLSDRKASTPSRKKKNSPNM